MPIWAWISLVLLTGIVAYANSFSGELIFDDTQAIVDNMYIRKLWPLSEAMKAPAQSSVSGRPIVSLTLAINYAIGGLNVWGYHAVNLAIHLLAGLAFFGIVRRTLSSGQWPVASDQREEERERRAVGIAGVCAIIWLVHPLQTESVTYLIQRAESLMGLFYLLTLYCFIRGIEVIADTNPKSKIQNLKWFAASVIACGMGMATKEVMATAPLAVLLYDRIFTAASWREVFDRRKYFYACLFATWGILGALVIGGPRSESAGFGLKHATPLQYALTQFGVILFYLRQTFWPDVLCLDWYWMKARYWWQIYPQMLAILVMLGATAWALWKRPKLGYLGACFFVILAPTSSIVPIADLAFEHRIYLSLASVVVLVVLLADYCLKRLARSNSRAIGIGLAIAVVCALTARTLARNADYHDGLALWLKTVRAAPWNPRGYTNVSIAYLKHGKKQEAIAAIDQATRIDPGYADAYRHLGKGLADMGDWSEAALAYRKALAIEPDDYKTLNNYAGVLQKLGDPRGAIEQFEKAVAVSKDEPLSWYNLGLGSLSVGLNQRAAESFEQFLRFDPQHSDVVGRRDDANINLGSALLRLKRTQDAIAHYEKLIAGRPDWAAAHYGLALAWTEAGKPAEAMVEYRRVIALSPAHADAYCNLAILLKQGGKLEEAEAILRNAIKIDSRHVPSLYNLGILLAEHKHQDAQAIAILEQGLRVAPDHEPTRQALHVLRSRKP